MLLQDRIRSVPINEFVFFFLVSLFLKFPLAYFLPLLPDEAYYWVWSKNIQLSYFDHPGMISWLFKLGHFLEPYGNAIRFPAIFINHLNYIFWFLIFRELNIPITKYYSWMLLTFLSPILGFGSILLTPDLPVMLFWSSCLYYFIRILKSKNIDNYIFLGISLGLGFLSKYHIVLFPLIGMVYLYREKRWSSINPKGVLFTCAFGLLFSIPVLYWNYENNFQSFTFQMRHGLESHSWKWQWPMEYLIGHFLLLVPPFVFYFFKANLTGLQNLFKYFSLGILTFFLLTSFRSAVEMNWTILAFPTFYLVVILSEIKTHYLKYAKYFFFLLNTILLGLMFNGVYPHGKIFEPFFFEKQKELVTKYRPLYGINYQIASSLWYFTKEPVLKVPRASRYDFFDTFPIDYQNFPATFYVLKEITNEYPQWLLELKPKTAVVKELERNYVVEKVIIK